MITFGYENEEKIKEYGVRVLKSLAELSVLDTFQNFNGSFAGPNYRKAYDRANEPHELHDESYWYEVGILEELGEGVLWNPSFDHGEHEFDDGTVVTLTRCSGAQKIALIFDVVSIGSDKEFADFLDDNVLKMEQSSLEELEVNYQSLNMEPFYYKEAVGHGVGQFFARTSELGECEITDLPDYKEVFPRLLEEMPDLLEEPFPYTIAFFWQERLEDIEYGEDTNFSDSYSDDYTYQSYSGNEYLTEAAIFILDEKYGTVPEIEELLDFIGEYDINDLHSGNIGKDPVTQDFRLWDFCGYN